MAIKRFVFLCCKMRIGFFTRNIIFNVEKPKGILIKNKTLIILYITNACWKNVSEFVNQLFKILTVTGNCDYFY